MNAVTAKILVNEPMAKHTSLGLGGPADMFAECGSVAALKELLLKLKKDNMPFFVIGGGTNLLVRDGGIKGACVRLAGEFSTAGFDGEAMICGAGLSLWKTLDLAFNAGLSGLENLAGIPGTVGGAVYGNAGTKEGEMKDAVRSVTVLDENLAEKEIPASAIRFDYRYSSLQASGKVILKATLSLSKGNKEDIKAAMDLILGKRKLTQPSGRSAGSVFRNPEGYAAGKLIEECGLKGVSVGGASVSELHANFMINTGSKASDMLKLIDLVKRTVREKKGVELKEEIRIVGEEA